MPYFAIIPAAGSSVRMRADRPKQYLSVQGEPLLQRVINVFSAMPVIQKVVVTLHAKDHWWPSLTLSHPGKVSAVIGGKERVHSVLLGLAALKEMVSPNDFVLVHDAARPFVTEKLIHDLMDAVKTDTVGGLVGLPVVDTIKQVDEKECVVKTISRTQLWQAQTPQCFRYAILKKAIEKALSDKQVVTDESSAIEYFGHHPKMVMGDSRNRKITFSEDLLLL